MQSENNNVWTPGQNHQTNLDPRRADARVAEQQVKYETITIERKTFKFSQVTNHLGTAIRITEISEHGGKNGALMIPASGIEDFIRAIANVCPEM